MAVAEIQNEIKDKLALIADPHMGISIVEMGLVREIEVDEDKKEAKITLSPTNPGCMSIANVAMASKLEVEKLDDIDKAEIKVIDHMMADTINEMVNKEE
ncbi:MAG: iron-sulfur cluster assembly protein [Methanosphaera sp.]|nr:iron-sulfur cluster assembly protein [Methanosphaera sp.]